MDQGFFHYTKINVRQQDIGPSLLHFERDMGRIKFSREHALVYMGNGNAFIYSE